MSVLVLSVLEGGTEELVGEDEELVENPEEPELVVAEEVEGAGETVDDAVVEMENEVIVVEDVLDDIPRLLEDEAEELELLIEDPGGVALLELLEEDGKEDGVTVELPDDEITVLPETLELPEPLLTLIVLLLELIGLLGESKLLEVTELLTLLGLVEPLDELRDEARKLVEDAIELIELCTAELELVQFCPIEELEVL
jgi:hypothetical protein